LKGYLQGNSSLCIGPGKYIDLSDVSQVLPRGKIGYFNILHQNGRNIFIDARWVTSP